MTLSEVREPFGVVTGEDGQWVVKLERLASAIYRLLYVIWVNKCDAESRDGSLKRGGWTCHWVDRGLEPHSAGSRVAVSFSRFSDATNVVEAKKLQ